MSSPTLFNMVVAELATLLDNVGNLAFTICVDDITIWAKSGLPGQQENTLHWDPIKKLLHSVDLRPSADKAVYVVESRGRAKKDEMTNNL